MGNWTKQKLSEIYKFQYGKGNKNPSNGGKYPVYGAGSIIGYFDQYNAEDSPVIGHMGANCGTVIFGKGKHFVTYNGIMALTKEGNNSLFGYYVLLSKDFRKSLRGSAHPFISYDLLNEVDIILPYIETQTRIASVLSAYDDLIENNEKRIKHLEEMAQLLYTEWFVKFKFPGNEKVKMVESGTEYGMVPEGWEVAPISKLAEFMNGYPFKPKQLGENGFPIVKIPELRSGILDKTPRNSGDGINKKYIIQTGDILFSWSATLLVNIWNSGEALLNQHLFKVTPKVANYKAYTFYTLVILVEKIKKHVVGATMQHLRKDTVESAQILIPSTEVLTAYEIKATKLLDEIGLLYQRNQTLSKIRDLLIPQLVTGKRELK